MRCCGVNKIFFPPKLDMWRSILYKRQVTSRIGIEILEKYFESSNKTSTMMTYQIYRYKSMQWLVMLLKELSCNSIV